MALPNHPFAKFAGILKQLAPTVLTAVGGPAGALAGQLIRKATGAAPDADIESVVADALTTPEGIEKIRLAELELKKFEADNAFKFADLEVQDRMSARDLAAKTSIYPQVSLSVLFVLGYFVILGMFFSKQVSVPMSDAFMVMLGVLTAGVPQILAFWLGSSSGSTAKSDTIASLAKQSGDRAIP